MSTRVRGADGRVRPVHRPVPNKGDLRNRTCGECGEPWYWAAGSKGIDVRRHYPGTFWQDDTDRSRW